ncbi:MAG: ribonuclease E/G [Clostridia bacterium]|nr:ribonuclease E/G [Clostridia bacterium]
MKRLLIQKKGDQRQFALLDEKRLLAFFQEQSGGVESEQIYLGVVDRIVKGMEAAFIRLDKDTVGFLPFSECKQKPRSGDKMLVQVKRPPTGEKAAYVTADISLAGRTVLFTPLLQRITLSKRIEDESERERLLEIGRRICPEKCGLVMRQESAGATEDEISREMQSLWDKWQQIQEKSFHAKAPCLLETREDILGRILREERGGVDEILCDDESALPPAPCPVRICENSFALYNVQSHLEKSLRRKIWLDCGGFLVIDRTEAMTVIDVNSGKFTGGKSGTENTFLKLNLEAAREIARLLRLRNIGGIILIDFVDMQNEESREKVSAALGESLQDDPVKTVLHGFTSLGLMEMTRKKIETQVSPLPICPRCHGTGLIEEGLT